MGRNKRSPGGDADGSSSSAKKLKDEQDNQRTNGENEDHDEGNTNDGEGFAAGLKESTVSQRVIDNLTNTMRADLSDIKKLLTSLGFDDFNHLIKWCSATNSKPGRQSKEVKETLRLRRFEFDEGLVSGAQQRLGIAFDEKNKPDKPVVKTVRCLVAIIKKHCPLLGTGEQSKRTIHGAKTECFFTTDEEFVTFFKDAMLGQEPGSAQEIDKPEEPGSEQESDKHEETDTTESDKKDSGDVDSPPTFRSNTGTVLKYNKFT